MAWLRRLREESSPSPPVPVPAIRKRGRSPDDDDAEESRPVRNAKKEVSRKEPVFRHHVRKMSAEAISSGRLQLRF